MKSSFIETVASEWIARRDAGLSPAEQDQFNRWLSVPEHARAFARHEKTWRLFDSPFATGAGDHLVEEVRRRAASHRRRKVAAVTGATALLLLAGVISKPWKQPAPLELALPPTVRLIVPEKRILTDGSIIELKPGSEIEVSYAPARRTVVLKSGTAYFTVAKDKTRPFVVVSNGVEVRAVGTAFMVQQKAANLLVVVTDGTVAVDPAPPADAAAIAQRPVQMEGELATLSMGSAATINLGEERPSVRIENLNAAMVDEQLAWRSPLLDFTGARLADAVRLISRSSAWDIRIADPTLADLEVSGKFRADNADAFVRLIEESLGLQDRREGKIISLYRAN